MKAVCTPVRVERFLPCLVTHKQQMLFAYGWLFLEIESLKRIHYRSARKGRPSLPLDYKSGIKFFVGTKHVTQYGVLGRTLTWLMWHRTAGNHQGKSHLKLYQRWLAMTQKVKQHVQICWPPRLRKRKYNNTMEISCFIKCKTVNIELLLQFSTSHKDTPVQIFYIYYRFVH